MERNDQNLTALQNLTKNVQFNLEHEKDWTGVKVHDSGAERQLLYGLPPRRMYVHPDEQIAILKAEKELGGGQRIPQPPEVEWVLPMHLAEKWTVERFAAVFDSIPPVPPAVAEPAGGPDDGNTSTASEAAEVAATSLAQHWRGSGRGKRIILAIVQDDSTISYYVIHDGIVKPRQN
ncbi:hypothetical protein MCOR27_002366 [Pyricularia oryzae]|uniref:tRNA-splicing endonuclease subunit Sen15 domain-containing protein n=1 Tax=Pyricularia grisea TaxID=148305 RepID=A0ABQ8NWZ9_PYRGI|nr:hypothetical protein MCOR01_004140 [Pyricularia oryzae]KAI6302810.1 hypothetical protein MCOR33_001897 [Pyricularia grisea]KAH9430792.1 hypothetical protein MCOR02_008120 [Pyricularia oryzae]KAI6257368.1 hypothetical protein MCOR19_006225 [Pyricularia oryzae]KAI6285217.1 hypothetical protein MCOR27_002366 [Pyricularia oryzae]